MVSENQLLREIGKEISFYLMSGEKEKIPNEVFSPDTFSLEGLEEEITDIDKILNTRYMTQEKVIDFVEELPRRLRSIKTETRKDRSAGKEIKGNIEWGQTLERRLAENYRDRTLFVTSKPEKNYDIDENLVLKKLLSTIYEVLENYLSKYIEEGHDWVGNWKNKESEAYRFKSIFEKNVHLGRIRESEEIDLTPRQVQKCLRSRKKLYQEAAELYKSYKKYFEGDKDKLVDVFQETSVKPDKDYKTFELFSLLSVIRAINDSVEDIKFLPIESDRDCSAKFENQDKTIKIYYDQTPKEINFSELWEDISEKRKRAISFADDVIEEYFGKDVANGGHSLRPDILVEMEKNQEKRYVLFEVKYSSRKDTIKRGIRELSEYIGFINSNEGYISEQVKDPSFLLIEKHPRDTSKELGTNSLEILDFEELKNKELQKHLKID